MLQRPSVQAQFDGYHYYPIGGGKPIPYEAEKETPKPKTPAMPLNFKSNPPNRIEFNLNQPIRIIEAPKIIVAESKPVLVEPPKLEKPKLLNYSVNFGFSRRTRDAYIAKELEKSALDQSVVSQQKQTLNNSFVNNQSVSDSFSDIKKELSKEGSKETQKRRTFSINASSLIPDRIRKQSRGSFHRSNDKSVIMDSQTIASYSTAERSRIV